MADRAKGMVRRIAEGVLEQLRAHARDYPDRWHRVPAWFELGARASLLTRPRPVVAVTVTGTEEATGGGTDRHRTRVTMSVLMIGSDAAVPDEALYELSADVRRAVSANEHLANVDGSTPVLQDGHLWIGPCTYSVEPVEGGAGVGVADQTVFADFAWTHDTP